MTRSKWLSAERFTIVGYICYLARDPTSRLEFTMLSSRTFFPAGLPAGLRTVSLLAAATCAVLSTNALALQPSERVENFRLLDHAGDSHELYYYDTAKAVVLLTQSNACKASTAAIAKVDALQQQHDDGTLQSFLINSSAGDSRAQIEAFAAKQGQQTPILMDASQLIGESMQLNTAGEMLILNTADWTVAYRGAPNRHADKALKAVLNGKPVAKQSSRVKGCDVAYPAQVARAEHANISYADDVAPILLDNCVSCHRQGGIGPWAMTNYTMIQGFAPMIREVLRTKRMPPWHADPKHGTFSNDRSLTVAEEKTLVHWIEAGAPRGAGEDPLVTTDIEYTEWDTEGVLGKPHYVVDIPASEIPASGVVDYKYHYVKNPIGRDVWVQAAEVLPGDRAVLHHVITAFGDMITEGKYKGRMKHTGGLRGYAPGITNEPFPENTGVFLPADATLEFQVHYTTSGKATVDESRMGLWFYDKAPEKQVYTKFIANGKIRIPAHAANHAEQEEYVIPNDAILYNVMPHAHFRGKAAEFRAFYPDGTEELLLSVPNYDFNWQTTYEFSKPKFVPEGTRIVQTNWWDNSAANSANPDPSIEVTWGEQSWEEMLFGAFLMRTLDADEARAMRTASDTSASPQGLPGGQ